jgi:hypothetical protein
MLEFTARKNQILKVSSRQANILVGCLLGDGYISPRGQIQIAHSEKQFAYVNWKYYELKSLAYGLPTKVSRFDPRYKKEYVQTRFWLRQYFRTWRKIFYPNGQKVFPTEITSLFNELSLTVWYMDDGNLYKGRHLKIATDGFDFSNRKKLQAFLLERFNLKSKIHANGKMRISSKSLNKFFEIVEPHIHSSMLYKVP